MADHGSVFANFMQEDAEITIQEGGETYLAVMPAYLATLGWQNNQGDIRNCGYQRNWFRNIPPNTRNYFLHLHLICIKRLQSDRLLLERIKLKAGVERGWWSERGADGCFSFHLENCTDDRSFLLGAAKGLALFIPPEWRSTIFLPRGERGVDVDSVNKGLPTHMDIDYSGSFGE